MAKQKIQLTKTAKAIRSDATKFLNRELKRQEENFEQLFKTTVASKKQILFIGGAYYAGKTYIKNKLTEKLEEHGFEIDNIDLNDFFGKVSPNERNEKTKLFTLKLNQLLINKKATFFEGEENEITLKLEDDKKYIFTGTFALSDFLHDELINSKSFNIFVDCKFQFFMGKKELSGFQIRTLRKIEMERLNKKFKISTFIKDREEQKRLEAQILETEKNANYVYNSSSILEPFLLRNSLLIKLDEPEEQLALNAAYLPLEHIKTSLPDDLLRKYL